MKISVKGVLIGGIVDVGSTILLGLPFGIYSASRLDVAHMPQDQVGPAIDAAMKSNVPMYVVMSLIGLACSVFGGYLSGRIAKHDEVLNGSLSAYLCVILGIYSVATGIDTHSLA